MEKSVEDASLRGEIAQLRAIMRGLASDDESEQRAASAQAGDAARVAAVLIRAVEAEHALQHATGAAAESALAAIITESLDALTREEAAQRRTKQE